MNPLATKYSLYTFFVRVWTSRSFFFCWEIKKAWWNMYADLL